MKLSASGFREYDARWLYPEQIDDDGMKRLGAALGTYLATRHCRQIVSGYDYRSYSQTLQQKLIEGLVQTGMQVVDIGLCLSPTAYFAQSVLDIPAVAMVTASHNENGWTGVKMGCEAPLTFGPEEINQLKAIALNGNIKNMDGGAVQKNDNMVEAYIADLARRPALSKILRSKTLRIVLACGHGTTGLFAPQLFERLGAHIIPLHCKPNWNFPLYTPNPENIKMMEDLSKKVIAKNADLGLAFDGDGDRCGFVNEKGQVIFADKIGVLLARHLAALHPQARFIADVKSTNLFATDPELQSHHAKTEFWITGHSYMKRRLHESGALAGFEKSGHFFFAPPIGRGYDDGLLSGVLLAELLTQRDQTLSQLCQSLPRSWASPTMAPFCADEKKYQIIDHISDHYQKRDHIAGRRIIRHITVNGIRVVLEDGSWLLARASSNKPSLVIVVESMRSESDLKTLFADIDTLIRSIPEVGEYDQKI